MLSTENDAIKNIRHEIKAAETDLIAKYPFLKHKNEIGLGIFVATLALWVLNAYAYYQGVMPAGLTIFFGIILTSILHELEHDIIHAQYYPKTLAESLMKWGIYVSRGIQPHPDLRKPVHLHHHKRSGQDTDIEEIYVGNGMKWGLKRFIVTVDQNLGRIFYYDKVKARFPEVKNIFEVKLIWIAVTMVCYASIYALALLWVAKLFVPEMFTGRLLDIYDALVFIGVVWAIPGYIRLAALAFITSSMHYFGDVGDGQSSLLRQTQVYDKWYFFPFNLATCNFGATHAIHHFVVNQPFYIRQMVANRAHKAMRENGVRFNDIGSFNRDNRFNYS